MMMNYLSRFLSEEDGAVTVDWVVLTAGVIGMSIAVIGGIRSAATDPADSVGASLANYQIN